MPEKRMIKKADGSETPADPAFMADHAYRVFLRDCGIDLPEYDEQDGITSDTTPKATPRKGQSLAEAPVSRGVVFTQGGTEISLSRVDLDRNIAKSRAMGDDMINVQTGRAAIYVPPHARGSTVRAALEEHDKKASKEAAKTGKKRLNLSAILNDQKLRYSYGFEEVEISVIGAVLVSSVEAAARKATEFVQERYPNVVVVPDMCEASRAMCRTAIRQAAKRLGESGPTREIKMAYYPGTELVSMVPVEDSIHEDDIHTWEIVTPLREWPTAGLVWRLVSAYGPDVVSKELGAQYAMLRIILTRIDRVTGYADVVCPGMSEHAGNFGQAWKDESNSLDYEYADIAEVDFGITAVSVGDDRVASAVRVSEEWVVATPHVSQTPDAVTSGAPMADGLIRRVGEKLLAVESCVPTLPVTPLPSVKYRAPKLGEKVRLRLVRETGEETAAGRKVVEAKKSKPCAVTEFKGGLCYVAGLKTQAGVSGSVYVAESDGAIVALHEGAVDHCSVGVPMVSDPLAVCKSRRAWYSGRCTNTGGVQSPVVERWAGSADPALYQKWVKVARSLNVGYAGLVESHPRASYVYGANRAVWNGTRFLSPEEAGQLARLHARAADAHEQCVLVAIDHSGVYMSHQMEMSEVEESLAAKGGDMWTELVRAGTLVVAVADAAVLGTVYRGGGENAGAPWIVDKETGSAVASVKARSDSHSPMRAGTSGRDRGEVGARSCERPVVRLARESVTPVQGAVRVTSLGRDGGYSVAETRDLLRDKFPYLNAHGYSGADIDECFTHSSCGAYAVSEKKFAGNALMAEIGRTALRTRLLAKWRSMGYNMDDLPGFASYWQTDDVKTVGVVELGLGEHLRFSREYVVSPRNDYPQLMDALIGLAYFYESDDVMDLLIGGLALYGDSPIE